MPPRSGQRGRPEEVRLHSGEPANREIHDVICYFGSRRKIFNVHFRNIRMEVGYDGGLMPDHVPHINSDTACIRALIQQVYA